MSAPPASRLTAGQVYRLIAPRRKWWLWATVLLGSWGTAGLFLAFASPGWRGAWQSLEIPLGFGNALSPRVVQMWASLAGACLGPMALFADIRSGRLQPLVLTAMDRPVLLRTYHRMAFTTVLLLLAACAPVDLLAWLAETGDLFCSAAGTGANLLCHAAIGCLSAAVGMALCAALGRQLWGVLLALLACWLLLVAQTDLLTRLGVAALNSVGWFEPQRVWVESTPQLRVLVLGKVNLVTVTLNWVVGAMEMLVSALLSWFALRFAAKHFDRLVTD